MTHYEDKPVTAEEAALLAFVESIVVQRVIYGSVSVLSFILALLAAESHHVAAAIVGFVVTLIAAVFYVLTRRRLKKLSKMLPGQRKPFA
jgi:hypothetical protein